VLFGATTPEQVAANVGSVVLAAALSADVIARLRAIGVP
jgi:aryl-alcohol dehydrogenase-like predicted oxidoreductase